MILSDPRKFQDEPIAYTNKLILVEFDEGIAWVTLNRPDKKNCMSPALHYEMNDTLMKLQVDPRANVLVITGAGESFSAGMDLNEFFKETDVLPPHLMENIRLYSPWWIDKGLMYYTKPTIAMVNGWCFGGAFTPLAACDLAYAADEATFGLSEINWGIVPAGNVTKAVESKMNDRQSMYYLMTGDTFNGKQATEFGLVNASFPKKDLKEKTREVALKLAQKNPTVVRAIKAAYKYSRDMDWNQSYDYLNAKFNEAAAFDPEKGKEKGMKQFLDDKTFKPGLANYKRPTSK